MLLRTQILRSLRAPLFGRRETSRKANNNNKTVTSKGILSRECSGNSIGSYGCVWERGKCSGRVNNWSCEGESPSVRRGPGKGQTSARSPQFIRHLLWASQSKNLPIHGESGASSLSDKEDRVSRAGLDAEKPAVSCCKEKCFLPNSRKRALLHFFSSLLFWKSCQCFFFFWEERIFQRGKMVFVLCLFLQLLFSPSVIAVVIFPICLCTNHVPFPILLPLTCSPPGFCLDVLKGCNTARVSDWCAVKGDGSLALEPGLTGETSSEFYSLWNMCLLELNLFAKSCWLVRGSSSEQRRKVYLALKLPSIF